MTNEKELPTIVTQENIVRETTKQKHSREFDIFAGLINVFITGFNAVGFFKIEKENESEYIWLLLLTRSLHSLRCSVDLMLKGYYSQSMSLLRSVTEGWFICENAHDNTIRDCLLRDAGRMPSFETLAKTAQASKVYEELYRYQSKFIHSSTLSLSALQETDTMRIAPTYDRLLFLSCAELFVRLSLLAIKSMRNLLVYLDKKKAESWADQNIQRLEDANDWLENLKEESG